MHGHSTVQPDTHPHFLVYRRNALLLAFDRRHWGFPRIFLFWLLLLLALKILVLAAFGRLVSPTLVADVAADASRFPFLIPPKLIVGALSTLLPQSISPDAWSDVVQAVGRAYLPSALHREPTFAMPYLRDYVDILEMALMALNLALLHIHWRLISQVPDSLWTNRVIDTTAVPPHTYWALVAKYDRIVNNIWVDIVSIGAAIVLTSLLYYSIISSGLYARLSPRDADTIDWQHEIALGWWAHPSHSLLLFILQVAIVSLVLYFIIRHNIVGIVCIAWIRDFFFRSTSDGNSTELRFDPFATDGCGGLEAVKSVLKHVYLSILVMAFALVLLIYYIPSSAGYVLVPLVAIFVFLNPLYVVVPLYVFRREMVNAKRERVIQLSGECGEIRARLMQQSPNLRAPSSVGDAELRREMIRYELLQEERRAVEHMPTMLFSFPRSLVYLASYVVPLVALVMELARG